MEIVRAPVNIKTFDLLDQIVTILGSTKTTFWPILESQDDNRDDLQIYSYKENVHSLTAAGDATEPFYPYRHVGGVHSLSLDAAENQFLYAADHADFSFGNGTTTDAAFSLGLWILARDITDVTLMAKWDTEAAAEDREWRLILDGSGKPAFYLYDDNANASEASTADTALTLNELAFLVVTYDGTESAPVVKYYLNGAIDNTTPFDTTETGAYVAMQAGAETPTIGCELDTNAANLEFTGRVALPFICGKELSAANVSALYDLGKQLLGLA